VAEKSRHRQVHPQDPKFMQTRGRWFFFKIQPPPTDPTRASPPRGGVSRLFLVVGGNDPPAVAYETTTTIEYLSLNNGSLKE
jgi:hypothetical protein